MGGQGGRNFDAAQEFSDLSRRASSLLKMTDRIVDRLATVDLAPVHADDLFLFCVVRQLEEDCKRPGKLPDHRRILESRDIVNRFSRQEAVGYVDKLLALLLSKHPTKKPVQPSKVGGQAFG
jgi:hypothetical protein